MSLVNRLSAFFLAALAVVLVGFSLSIYLLARTYLIGQAEARLLAALDTLGAAVEPDRSGLEWEGAERITLGRERGADQPRWDVRERHGQIIDRSANLEGADLSSARQAAPETDDATPQAFSFHGEPWLLMQRQIVWDGDIREFQADHSSGPSRYTNLVLSTGVSLAPVYASLRILATTLAALSLGIWLAAAVLGRWLGRRALAPVTRMATAAREMGAADLSARLPGPATPDELGTLHQSFNELLDRLQEAFERQRRFTGDASHQLRTPLTAMLGQVELALRRDRSAEEYQRALTAVHGQADRLRQIVEALLFVARADAEAQPGDLEAIDLAEWLPGHLGGWSTHPRANDLRCAGVDHASATVRAQPLLLGQLLDNLLDNAFRYSAPGTPVTVTLGHDGDHVTLAVRDHGNGVAPEDVPHVFDPFYRAAETRLRSLPGTGLGLSVARRIATAFGGTLEIDRMAKPGARFVLHLPRTRSES